MFSTTRSSLVERLHARSEQRPIYNLDDSDEDADFEHGKPGKTKEKLEQIDRTDAKENSCQACGESPHPDNWRCPECVSPLNDIEKILDCEMRPSTAEDNDALKLGSKQIFVKQYLVKWKGLSYLQCTWGEDDAKEYFVKYKELSYDECCWEFESDIAAFQPEIERFKKIESRSHRASDSEQKRTVREAADFKYRSKEFQQFEHSPEFLSGGSLHPYQLEGLNFLCFSWSKQTHVILADEMGLGKTIRSIAFLASLFEENFYPHLVVAPLSTLRNWEQEFATWAPQMNVVMYVGSAQACAVIREYEFYYPKNHKKIKKKKSGQVVGESKQDRIKFDVLLTSYETINLDTTSLKPIKWECMIVDEGHRLKNKDSKLFLSLKQYTSNHRVLLTGTPL
ncbi:hypothetical protein SLA2020_484870 [Shorea laevis]